MNDIHLVISVGHCSLLHAFLAPKKDVVYRGSCRENVKVLDLYAVKQRAQPLQPTMEDGGNNIAAC